MFVFSLMSSGHFVYTDVCTLTLPLSWYSDEIQELASVKIVTKNLLLWCLFFFFFLCMFACFLLSISVNMH